MNEENQAAADESAKTALFEALGVEDEQAKVEAHDEVKPEAEKLVEAEQVSSDNDYSEVEQEALKLGWKPEGVPGRKTKGAEEWMDDYSLYRKINDLGKQVQEKNHLLENVAKHFESVQDASYKQAKREFDDQVSDLRQLAADTIDDGELSSQDVIAAYENDLKVLQEDHVQELTKLNKDDAPKVSSKEEIMNALSQPEQDFVNKNEKLLFSQKPADLAIQAYVVNRNNELANEGLSPEDRIVTLERDLTNIFPHTFGISKKVKAVTASKVESGSISGKPSKQFSLKNLAPDQRELYEYFVDQGVPADELLTQFQMIIDESK